MFSFNRVDTYKAITQKKRTKTGHILFTRARSLGCNSALSNRHEDTRQIAIHPEMSTRWSVVDGSKTSNFFGHEPASIGKESSASDLCCNGASRQLRAFFSVFMAAWPLSVIKMACLGIAHGLFLDVFLSQLLARKLKTFFLDMRVYMGRFGHHGVPKVFLLALMRNLVCPGGCGRMW